MAISANTLAVLLNAPQPNQPPDEFNANAFAFSAILHTLGIEMNETAAALNLNATNSTSSDSMAIGTGTKNFEVEPNKSYTLGMSVRIAADIDPTNWMNGDLIAYDPLTGNISVQVTTTQGSGTYAAWSISQSFGGLTPGAVTTLILADLAVTAAKVADQAITNAKLHESARQLGIGDIKVSARSTPPTGWLALPVAPTNLSRTAYPELFSAIGTAWGAGDGSTTFGMPWISADGTILSSSGASIGTSTPGQVLNHTHPMSNFFVNVVSGANGIASTQTGAGGTYSTLNNTGGGSANIASGSRFLILIRYQ